MQCATEMKPLNRRGKAFPNDPDVDASGFIPMGVVAVPMFSPSSGALMGVCEMLNRRGPSGPFFNGDDELLLMTTLKVSDRRPPALGSVLLAVV